ncbi:MAG: hypothetical protein M1814_001130 [Vezdaea aestivalis]|nr:MAG: hypothetical protein M1814_001130 [Vezdaea aestivalis]
MTLLPVTFGVTRRPAIVRSAPTFSRPILRNRLRHLHSPSSPARPLLASSSKSTSPRTKPHPSRFFHSSPKRLKSDMKRIIICCDGTWVNSDNGYTDGSIFPWGVKGHLSVASNVTRMCRAIQKHDKQGIPQLVYYQAGVGTGNGNFDKLVGGGTGLGLSEHIREAYGFLTNNYVSGDQIFLMGFSRGAFTARSIAGLISEAGILHKTAMESFYAVFEDYQKSVDTSYVATGDKPFPNRPKFGDPEYKAMLGKLGLSQIDATIQAIAVWDTVGSLGIPETGIGKILQPFGVNDDYKFHDTKLSEVIHNAFQALALDEQRGAFQPAVWEKPAGISTNLHQVWFPGVHSSVGGGYDDAEISDITLTWMMDQLSTWIEFDDHYIEHEYGHSVETMKTLKKPAPAWGQGFIPNSFTGVSKVFWKYPRTPGNYTNAETKAPLAATNEKIHPSVRLRTAKGLNVEGRGPYKPSALDGWSASVDSGAFKWKYSGAKKPTQGVLEEAKLGPMELKLLNRYPDELKWYQSN